MNNGERILQILTDMQQDISGVKRDVAGLKQSMSSFEDRLDEQKSIILNLENTMGKRIEALYDGHMLNKEKHDILERRVDDMELRVDKLEIAVG